MLNLGRAQKFFDESAVPFQVSSEAPFARSVSAYLWQIFFVADRRLTIVFVAKWLTIVIATCFWCLFLFDLKSLVDLAVGSREGIGFFSFIWSFKWLFLHHAAWRSIDCLMREDRVNTESVVRERAFRYILGD